METTNMQPNNGQEQEEEVVIAEIFFHYFRHWKWFLLSIFICAATGFLYLKYTTKEYKVASKTLIKDNKKGQTGLDYNAFEDLGISTPRGSFDNEIELLSSKTLLREVADSLKIGISYYVKGRIKAQEIYTSTPLFVSVANQSNSGSFTINSTGENTFTINSEKEKFQRTFTINEEVSSPWGVLSFKKNPFGTASFPIEVTLHSPKYYPKIQVTPINKTSTVVEVSMVTPTPQKGEDIINTLIGIYNRRAVEEKNYVATNTIRFIDERFAVISGELESAEKEVEAYKRAQGLTNIEAEAQLYLSASSDYDKRISELETQLNTLRSIKNYVMSPDSKGSGAPANVGLTDPTILNLISKYNEEILAKNRNTIGVTDANPIVREYDDRITLLKDNLLKGITISESSMQTTLRELRKQENIYLSRARGLSTQERESRELYRQKDIKESLFIYLMQKREETGLSLALATPNALEIDKAERSQNPVSPKRNVVALAALLLGVIIPILVIYIRDLFDYKLHSKEQLQKTVKAPFLGEVPIIKSDKIFPTQHVRSGIAEKFRIITSNLGFIVSGDRTRTVMVTSSFSGEGKSFFSQNLAMSLATLGKKTLLIDLDMRKSMTNKTLGMDPGQGVAMFLSDPSLKVSDITFSAAEHHKNLDIIPVTMSPPNPAELLASDRLDLLFESVKEKYDFIVVDTAPIGLVADAFRINQFADASIFVTRADYTDKSSLLDIESMYRNNKLRNLTTVINAISISKQYGYGYGNKKNNYYTEENS